MLGRASVLGSVTDRVHASGRFLDGDALDAAGVTDAQAGGGTLDYEKPLEIDPDTIAVRLSGAISDRFFRENIVEHFEDHSVASDLTAVQEGRVYYA